MTYIPKQTNLRIAVRYLAGRPLDGYRRTDATWLRPGTRSLDGQPASRWHMMAGWKRTATRIFVPPGILAYAIAYLTEPTITTAGTGAVASGTGFLVGRNALRRWQLRAHRRDYVLPLHHTLAAVLGDGHTDPDEWLSVPVDFQEDGSAVRIALPPHMPITADIKKAVREVIRQKLGLRSPDEAWHTIGAKPYVLFTPAPKPPERVTWADIRAAVEAAPETAPVLGIGSRDAIVDADLEADSPHILVSAGSGGGKSVLTKLVGAQGLHHGSALIVFDYKRSSQKWAEGLPGVLYCKDIEDIHNVLLRCGAECELRNRAAEDEGYNPHRIYVLVEEWNALAAKLNTYWENIREKTDPKRSPAVQAISDITFMGRHVKMNVIGVAQMMTARTTGGPETRENFATRALTRYTLNAWRMLAPEVWPAPKKSRTPGRWQIVKNGEATETQVAFLTDEEAREWAVAGKPCPVDVFASQTAMIAPTLPEPAGTVPERTLVGLRDAVAQLPGDPITLDAIRKARQRVKTFPTPKGKDGTEDLFDLDELIEWKKRRDAVRLAGKAA